MPSACVSTIMRNSLRTGSGDSLAMMRRQSLSGRPALTPRTMTSMALANSSRNFFTRRFLQEAEDPARQAEAGGEGRPTSEHERAARRRRPAKTGRARGRADADAELFHPDSRLLSADSPARLLALPRAASARLRSCRALCGTCVSGTVCSTALLPLLGVRSPDSSDRRTHRRRPPTTPTSASRVAGKRAGGCISKPLRRRSRHGITISWRIRVGRLFRAASRAAASRFSSP